MTLCKTKEEVKPMLYQTITHNLTEVIIHSLSILTPTVPLLFNCRHQPQCNNIHFHKKDTHSNKLLSKCKYHIKLYSMNLNHFYWKFVLLLLQEHRYCGEQTRQRLYPALDTMPTHYLLTHCHCHG